MGARAQACEQARDVAAGEPPSSISRIAVNLSPRQFRDPRLIDDVAAVLVELGPRPRRRSRSRSPRACCSTTAKPRWRACTGSRRSACRSRSTTSAPATRRSAACASCRSTCSKIDKAFIDGVATDTESSGLVEAILRMAETLSLDTIAEGVEQLDQADHLARLGSQLVQGYLYSRPLPAAQIPDVPTRAWAPVRRRASLARRRGSRSRRSRASLRSPPSSSHWCSAARRHGHRPRRRRDGAAGWSTQCRRCCASRSRSVRGDGFLPALLALELVGAQARAAVEDPGAEQQALAVLRVLRRWWRGTRPAPRGSGARRRGAGRARRAGPRAARRRRRRARPPWRRSSGRRCAGRRRRPRRSRRPWCRRSPSRRRASSAAVLERLAGLLLLALPQAQAGRRGFHGHGESWQNLTIGASQRKSVTVMT